MNRIINEIGDTPKGQRALGAVAARANSRYMNTSNREEELKQLGISADATRTAMHNENPSWGDDHLKYYESGFDDWLDWLDNNVEEGINMNKKLIRLTESDLHRIVKESVNKILTELDWKTYANAARKRYGNAYADNSGRATNQQELEKGNQLSQAANNAFQKQHGGTTINRASQPQQAGYYDPAKKDYQDYMNGKSKYVQGQGWQ